MNESLSRIVIGMHDYNTGLDIKTFVVSADFAINGVAAGKDLAGQFRPSNQGVWELTLDTPIAKLPSGNLRISVKDGPSHASNGRFQ